MTPPTPEEGLCKVWFNMRQYETIWVKLKENLKVSISSPRHYHARIIKAVKKEKWKDLAFKLVLSEQDQSARLICSCSGPVITFSLQIIKQFDLADL